jgi:hypothetical protein
MSFRYIVERPIGNNKIISFEFDHVNDLKNYYKCSVGGIYYKINHPDRKHDMDSRVFGDDIIKKVKREKIRDYNKILFWPVCSKCHNKIDNSDSQCCS